MGVCKEIWCEWKFGKIQSMTCSTGIFTNTWTRFFRNILPSNVPRLFQNIMCTCCNDETWNCSNGYQRCIPKWRFRRRNLYVTTWWIHRWNKSSLQTQPFTIWTKTIWMRMELSNHKLLEINRIWATSDVQLQPQLRASVHKFLCKLISGSYSHEK